MIYIFKIIFYEDMDLFIEELVKVFPKEKENFKRFYKDLLHRDTLCIYFKLKIYIRSIVILKQ